MKPTKTKKAFDCVESKREAQERIYAHIKDLTPAAEIDYFRRTAGEGPLGKTWKAILKHGTNSRIG